MNLISYFQREQTFIIDCIINSVELISWALVISLLVWFPIGVLIFYNKTAAKIVLGVANLIFCIPSLAMFSIMVTIPFLGIGRTSALLALVLYAMMPLLKSIYAGLSSVDESIIEAAKGMGMDKLTILREVRLPLATRSIFSGFRVSTIMIIGLSTIATYIGERNIGRIISTGLAREDMDMILSGTLLISVIAIVIDLILEFIESKIRIVY